jgi:sulfur carrier protein
MRLFSVSGVVFMARVVVRFPKPRMLEFEGRRPVYRVLEELGMNPEGVIVIKGDTLLTGDAVIEGDDEVEVRPAISGG